MTYFKIEKDTYMQIVTCNFHKIVCTVRSNAYIWPLNFLNKGTNNKISMSMKSISVRDKFYIYTVLSLL